MLILPPPIGLTDPFDPTKSFDPAEPFGAATLSGPGGFANPGGPSLAAGRPTDNDKPLTWMARVGHTIAIPAAALLHSAGIVRDGVLRGHYTDAAATISRSVERLVDANLVALTRASGPGAATRLYAEAAAYAHGQRYLLRLQVRQHMTRLGGWLSEALERSKSLEGLVAHGRAQGKTMEQALRAVVRSAGRTRPLVNAVGLVAKHLPKGLIAISLAFSIGRVADPLRLLGNRVQPAHVHRNARRGRADGRDGGCRARVRRTLRIIPMRALLALGILATTLGCTVEHEEHEMNNHNHNQHHSHHDHHQHQHAGHAHQHGGPETGAQLIVATDPADPVAGRPVTLRLMIHAADGTMVRDFDVVHDEKVHLVVVRDGLDHFAHIHPKGDAKGNLTVTHTFPVGGTYRLFADYAPTGGGHATAKGVLAVGGNFPPAPALAPNAPGEVVANGVRATVAAAPLKAGSPARVIFALRDEQGEPVRLETYMGELGHLMFVGVGTGRYVHVHPAGGGAARGTIEFEAHFPEAGLYKGWGQFKRDGQVRVVPFVLKVE